MVAQNEELDKHQAGVTLTWETPNMFSTTGLINWAWNDSYMIEKVCRQLSEIRSEKGTEETIDILLLSTLSDSKT